MDLPNIDSDWLHIFQPEFDKEYMKNLFTFLREERKKDKIIFPQKDEFFFAFKETPFKKVRVVILGQDPYHGEGEAHGLSFSVKRGVRIPPSLQNIYKELKSDLQINRPPHGNLESWAHEGVLLLNSILTVEKDRAASHRNIGWERFTDYIIKMINDRCENVVFILWGSFALSKCKDIDQNKHFIVSSVHPSPLSAYRGFFGSKPFSRTNEYFKSQGLKEIDWKID